MIDKTRIKYERLIAETHFQLAIAYSLANNKTSSDASFAQALEHLEKHKSDLQTKIDNHSKESDEDKSEVHRLEVQVKEVAQLISDVAERQKENVEPVKIAEEPQPARNPLDQIIPGDYTTHLINKTRPATEEPTADAAVEGDAEAAPKKAKLDCTGDAPTAPTDAPEPTA